MTKIKIYDLEPIKPEIEIKTLNGMEAEKIFGGEYLDRSQMLNFGFKALEFFLVIFAIDAITWLSTSFYFKDIE
ncbi:MAG TPA: hypothetical protein VK203_07575 [Nostocaceae cyanobacterium]|nr:hypothetical protein [Nostocaceae cyanobacterium]